MGFNVILLTGDEEFIRSLNPSELEIVEKCEEYNVNTLTITYPLSEDISKDMNDFRQGNKLWIQGATGLKDCLYIIDEEVSDDLWQGNNITLTLEEVLVELNYAPIISQLDVASSSVLVTQSVLTDWFGDYYNILTPENGAVTSYVTLNGSMTRMSWLRSIEEQTGNMFITSYSYDNDEKVIKRYLKLVKPVNAGTTHNDIIDLGYNTDDIVYTVDESECFKSISPVIDYDSDNITRANLSQVLKEYKALEVDVNEEIPMILTQKTGAYPTYDEGVIVGSGVNKKYWRRTPNDTTFAWLSYGLFKYAGTASADGDLPSASATHKNKYWVINNDGTYKGNTCKSGDYVLCTGTKYVRLGFATNGDGTYEYYEATAWWKAPYNKQKNELSVVNANDTKTSYNNIYCRLDSDKVVYDNNEENSTLDPEEEAIEDATIEDRDNVFVFNTPKMGTLETTETDKYIIFNESCKSLKEHSYKNVTIEVGLKDLAQLTNGTKAHSFDVHNLVNVNIPSFNEVQVCVITGTEKNPHLPGENKITLASMETNQALTYLVTPDFIVDDISIKPNNNTKYTGKLATIVEDDTGDYPVLIESGLSGKLVTMNIVKPQSNRTTVTTTKTKVPAKKVKKQTLYYDKYGRTPDKKYVVGVGRKSNKRDKYSTKQYMKGLYTNKCPYCLEKNKLFYTQGGSATVYDPITGKKRTLSKKPSYGNIVCSHCGSIYSVEGHHTKGKAWDLKRSSLKKSSKTDLSRLLKGKLVYKSVKAHIEKAHVTTDKKTSTSQVAGWTKTYTTITDRNGNFSFNLNLGGMEDEDYTLEFMFGGDLETNPCSESVQCSCDVKALTATKYVDKTKDSKTNATKKSTVTKKQSYKRIKRGSGKGYSGVVSKTVWNKGKSLAKGKRNLAAVKSIANWVSNRKHVPYIYKNNFYHPPSTTLKKGGNCACKTDLFFHLLEGAGLLSQQGGPVTAYYVHMHGGGKGHYYAQLVYKDSNSKKHKVYVDVTKSSSPWGHVCSGYKTPVVGRTKYPKLPNARIY